MGGQAPGSLREGWREDRRLECGEQTGQTGQAGRWATAHGEAGRRGSGSSVTDVIEVFSRGPRDAVKQRHRGQWTGGGRRKGMGPALGRGRGRWW